MKKLIPLCILSLLAIACDNGSFSNLSDNNIKYKTTVEREITADENPTLLVFSAKVSRNIDVDNGGIDRIEFTCPCYLGDPRVRLEAHDVYSAVARIEGLEKFSISLLSGAENNVKIENFNSIK